MSLSDVSLPSRVADEDESVGFDELALAARNSGMPLELMRHDVTPIGAHYLLTHCGRPSPSHPTARCGHPSRSRSLPRLLCPVGDVFVEHLDGVVDQPNPASPDVPPWFVLPDQEWDFFLPFSRRRRVCDLCGTFFRHACPSMPRTATGRGGDAQPVAIARSAVLARLRRRDQRQNFLGIARVAMARFR